MSGPFKFATLLAVAGLLALGAQAQNQEKNQPSSNAPVRAGGQGSNNAQHSHVGDWLRLNRGKSFDQQKQSLENDPEFKKLPADRQQRLQQRLLHFNSLPPEKQDRILKNMDKLEHMSPQQRAQARAMWDRMRLLPQERRGLVRQQIHSMDSLNPDQRQKVFASDQYIQQFSPEERDLVQRGLELHDQIGFGAGPDENESPR
jgi:Protein of unknown function (DUF3106)